MLIARVEYTSNINRCLAAIGTPLPRNAMVGPHNLIVSGPGDQSRLNLMGPHFRRERGEAACEGMSEQG